MSNLIILVLTALTVGFLADRIRTHLKEESVLFIPERFRQALQKLDRL